MDAVGVAILLVLVCLLAAWVVALVDAVRRPQWQWDAARRSKPGWVIGVALCGWIAGVVYLVSVRRELTRATRAMPTSSGPPPRARPQPQPQRTKVPLRKKDWGDPWKDD